MKKKSKCLKFNFIFNCYPSIVAHSLPSLTLLVVDSLTDSRDKSKIGTVYAAAVYGGMKQQRDVLNLALSNTHPLPEPPQCPE